MGNVQELFTGGSSLDTTNAVCSFNGTIEHIGRVHVAVYRHKIVYQESKGCSGCHIMPMADTVGESVEFRNINAMQRYIPCLSPMGPRGIKIFIRSGNDDEILTIKGPTEEQFNLIVDAWKKSSWPKEHRDQ